MSIFIGIDPGLMGAAACIDSDGRVIRLADTPVLTINKNSSVRHEPDRNAMAQIIKDMIVVARGNVHVAIERVHSMPDQGAASGFSFGMGYGIWLGILAAFALPTDLIPPQRWKKVMMDGMGKEKDASRIRAKELFPDADLALKKHHGRADALLIAEYRRRLG